MRKRIIIENAPSPVGPYSQGVVRERVHEGLLFTSGQIGIDLKTGKLVDGIEEQTKLCLKYVKAIVEAAGGSVDKILKTTVYLTDMNNFDKMNEIYGGFFKRYSHGLHQYPSRTTVQVAKLPKNALVEIEAIAEV